VAYGGAVPQPQCHYGRAPAGSTDLVADLLERARQLAGTRPRTDRLDALVESLRQWEPDRRSLELCSDGQDVPGTVFEALLSGAERRDAGQFSSPHYAADIMAAWLLQEPVQLLLDPGVGSGRLLYRAGLCEPPPERMLGLDINPRVLELARLNLKWRGLAERAELRTADFLLESVAEQPDAAIVNPPYSRHHAIDPARKREIHRQLEARLAIRPSQLSALHVLFLVRTVEVCRSGARIAFVTPSGWLDASYGVAIKKWVLERCAIDAIVQFPENDRPFGSSVMSSAAITLLTKTDDADDRRMNTRVVRIPSAYPSPDVVVAAVREPAGSNGPLRVRETKLVSTEKWSRRRAPRKDGVALGELAVIRRGIATGNNAFFVLSEATRREWKLPKDVLRPCIAAPRLHTGLEIGKLDELPDDRGRWVLACWDEDAEAADNALGSYLRHGRELGVHKGYLASHRTPWFGLDKRDPPALLWPYFNRARLRFVRNRTGAVPLNTWVGIEPRSGIDADLLWKRLNETQTLRGFMEARRSYAGMGKLEPRELARVLVNSWRPR
jgi:adenine-specific DNA-methyltransferase